MRIDCLTLFPQMLQSVLEESIIGRAVKNEILDIRYTNIRDFAENKHNRIDDSPYGGGMGMVMQAEPIYRAFCEVTKDASAKPRVIYLSPQGRVFNQAIAKELSTEEHLVFLCGHYEGVDERVLEALEVEELSIGDYVLTGGEIAAMAVIDAVARLVPGVLPSEEAYSEESLYNGLLEYPQYTRPPVFMGKEVPEVLLSGHHEKIEKWRREQSILRTLKKRPELLLEAELTEAEYDWVESLMKEDNDGFN
ncbi:MAG: tRNA (guanosine(37)-N1)-methyltransferase TrmD [Ruminococcaceae bacterium]|nr:tRNA (guanosine(37)-N1)-methyltransferase TrmD [Oscillospiraceae bacterium]